MLFLALQADMKTLCSVLLVICVLCSLLFFSEASYAWNETDGVFDGGLFPLGEGGKWLRIKSEIVTLDLTQDSIRITRLYEIENVGAADSFIIGTVCGLNSRIDSPGDCGLIRVDGEQVVLDTSTSYLVDEGSYVRVKRMGENDVARLVNVDPDGIILFQSWGSFRVHFKSGECKLLDLRSSWKIHPCRVVDQLRDQFIAPLTLYAEKFWAGLFVPYIEFRVGIENFKLSRDLMTPRGPYAKYSTMPVAEHNSRVVWRIQDYRPNKKKYSYGFHLLHPFSIDFNRICEAYRAQVGMDLCKPHLTIR
jgi:hypothetical protein